MHNAMSFFCCGSPDDWVDLSKEDAQDGLMYEVRRAAAAKMSHMSEVVRSLLDDDTFKDRADKEFIDLTIAAEVPGAKDRAKMLIEMAAKLERVHHMWWTAECEHVQGLHKAMKDKWESLERARCRSRSPRRSSESTGPCSSPG